MPDNFQNVVTRLIILMPNNVESIGHPIGQDNLKPLQDLSVVYKIGSDILFIYTYTNN